MLTKRDFLGDETWRAWVHDEQQLLEFRNQVSSKAKQGQSPTQEELAVMAINKCWISFYGKVLYEPPPPPKKKIPGH